MRNAAPSVRAAAVAAFLAGALSIFHPAPGVAAELAGVILPDRVEAEGKSLLPAWRRCRAASTPSTPSCPTSAREEAIVFTYAPGRGVSVEVKGQVKGVIPGDDFARALFSIWLGPKPPDPDLKSGLLGKT